MENNIPPNGMQSSNSGLENVPPVQNPPKKRFLKLNKNHVFLGVAILAIIATGVLLFNMSNLSGMMPSFLGGSSQSTAQKAMDYINKNLIAQGKSASLGEVSQESGLIKMQVKVGTDTYDSYVTKDGKLFFVEGIKLSEN